MEAGVVLHRSGPSLAALLRWSGLALVAGGLLLAVASALHPSRETTATILEAEVRLVAAHVLFTLSSLLILFGLPGLYGAHSVRMGTGSGRAGGRFMAGDDFPAPSEGFVLTPKGA
jgi:hypothetical protein